MSHLGDRAAALVDGQLGPAEAERAAQHLAGCRGCRETVELERLIKHRLGTLGAPEPSHDFVGLLMAMGGPAGPLPPRERRLPVASPVPAVPRPAGRPASTLRPGGRTSSRAPGREPSRFRLVGRPRPHLAVAALAAACFVGAGVAVGGAGVAAGSSAAPSNGVRPAAPVGASLVAQRGSSRLELPFTTESAVWTKVRP